MVAAFDGAAGLDAMNRRWSIGGVSLLFVEVLQVAWEMGLLKLGTIGLDGTKIHADASRHSALSWDHASRIEARLKVEVAALMARAEAKDRADVPDGMSIPDERIGSMVSMRIVTRTGEGPGFTST